MATSANVYFGKVGGLPAFEGADITNKSADVASGAQSRASVAANNENVIRVWCPVAMYVAWGANPDASVSTGRVGIGAEQSFEINNVPNGTKVAVLNA